MNYSKIRDLDQLAAEVARQKQRGQIVVHCHGCFDLVHLGHINHFQDAKTQGDILIVTVTEDRFVNKGAGRPLFTQEQRCDYLSALELIDFVAINRWPTAIETIYLLKPNIYAKGTEYENPENDKTGNICLELKALEAVGGKPYFSRGMVYSSTDLIHRAGLRGCLMGKTS